MKKMFVISAVISLFSTLNAHAVRETGGVGDSSTVVCQEKRGNEYTYFKVLATAQAGQFVGQYSDARFRRPMADWINLSCQKSSTVLFSCIENRPGEGQIRAEVRNVGGVLQVTVGRSNMMGTLTAVDQLECQSTAASQSGRTSLY